MMALDLETHEAVMKLSEYTERYVEMFQEMAQRSGIFIIGGSHPVPTEEGLVNAAHLFTPAVTFTPRKNFTSPREKGSTGASSPATV